MTELLQHLVDGISQGAIYALIAVGYTMVYGVLQLINFAHGDVFMVGAIISLYAATGRIPPAMPWWLHMAVVIAFALGVIIPFLVGPSWQRAVRAVIPFAAIYIILIPTLFFASHISRHLPGSSWWTAAFALFSALVTCGVIG